MIELVPTGLHEEHVYWKPFRLVVSSRTPLDAKVLLLGFDLCQLGEEVIESCPHEEPPYVKPFDRANRPRHIAIAPVTPDVETVKHFRKSAGTASALTTCASASISTRTASRVVCPLWTLVYIYQKPKTM